MTTSTEYRIRTELLASSAARAAFELCMDYDHDASLGSTAVFTADVRGPHTGLRYVIKVMAYYTHGSCVTIVTPRDAFGTDNLGRARHSSHDTDPGLRMTPRDAFALDMTVAMTAAYRAACGDVAVLDADAYNRRA